MPTRSVKLKLIVPRGDQKLEVARSLWDTHDAINQAVRYYEEKLLLMRGQRYFASGEWVEEDAVRQGLIKLVKEAQSRNTILAPIADTDAVELLRRLYEAIAPSAIGEKGNAQNANRYLGPLTDRDSRGELDVFDKIDNLPDWIGAVRLGDPAGFEAATTWLETEDGKRRLRKTGAPPAWLKALRRGDATWPSAFVADVERKRLDAPEIPCIVRQLKGAGILPLFPTFVSSRMVKTRAAVGRWDRLAFRLAVAHLLSWESWGRRAAEEHAARKGRAERFRAERLTGELASKVEALRRYEKERKAELDRVALPMGDRDFLITERMARGWIDLRDRWIKAKDRSNKALSATAADEQTRRRGRFGDPDLFRWLARPENHHVWIDPTIDPVGLLARLNAMDRLVERSREAATMTLPDSRLHPRSVQWEAKGGSNFRNYGICRAPTGELRALLPLLRAGEDGRYYEATVVVPIAPSAQFQDPEFATDGRKRNAAYKTSSGEALHGVLGSADLLLDWGYLRGRSVGRVQAGDIGPAWLKIAIDIEPQYPAGITGKLPAAAIHFQTAAGQRSKRQAEVTAGFRVLSVDLGVRTFAACSVFELKSAKPDTGLAFHVPDLDLWAVHERSFLLDLPGEAQSNQGEQWREQATAELRRLRRALGRHRRLLQSAMAETEEERRAFTAGWREAVATDDAWPFEDALCTELESGTTLPQPVWEQNVKNLSKHFRQEFGGVVQEWRQRTRKRSDEKFSGKSGWAIQHLTDVRRFLQGWSLAGRESGEIRRLDRETMGTFAAHLLDHLDGLKDDRLKTGADLIVQAARGFRRGGDGRWVQSHAPCHVVLFEDLSRYRMRTDRPRRENSQLMKWAHRAVPAEAAMQGELYGIVCLDTGAAFSSRYRATTMTPGIRCHVLTKRDLADPAYREVLERENAGLDVGTLKPGDVVPLPGGELFISLEGEGLCRIHADINAAQNLQRRFWTRHGDAFRLPARKVVVGDSECWVPVRVGKRLFGALGSYGRLVPTGHDMGSCRWEPLTPKQWRTLAGAEAATSDEGVQDPEMEDLLGIEEDALEHSGETVVFFRDPSGEVLPPNLWFPSLTFWSVVKAKTVARMKKTH